MLLKNVVEIGGKEILTHTVKFTYPPTILGVSEFGLLD